MTTKYAIGMTVRLKAGGPDMSVKMVPTPHINHYTCQWFAGKKLEQGFFAEASIELVTPTVQK